MFRIFEPGLSRRELIRVGGLSSLGLSLPDLLRGQTQGSNSNPAQSFGKAKNVIFLWLQGGPPQHETFDPKPNAPAEIRGEFRPIATNVPGIDFCELLPRTARIADQLAVVRSMATANDLHDASGYWILTGKKYTGTESRQISPTDWPYFGSIVKLLKPSEAVPGLSSVWLPDLMRLNDNVTPAGQTAGFLGKRWDPDRFLFDPFASQLKLEGLSLPDDVSPLRLSSRRSLLHQVEQHLDRFETSGGPSLYDLQASQAYGLLTSGKARQAFDISAEPEKVVRHYGGGPWAKCLILARRLIEAGARLVHVNWPREGGDTAVSNPLWDTHAQNADRLQNVLCPMFDVGFSAMIDDLKTRGLLDETLIVAIGEFGRTPKINAHGGRDHWGHVFSFLLAGAGIETAQVYGSSDRQGAYPQTNKVEPQDLIATLFHLMGIGHDTFFHDQTNRPIRVTHGEPVWQLLGGGQATTDRQKPGGSLAFVPEFSSALLSNPHFPKGTELTPAEPGRRIQGWQASSLLDHHTKPGFGAWSLTDSGKVCIGIRNATIADNTKTSFVVLAQELRNPRAGKYLASARFNAVSSADFHKASRNSIPARAYLILFGYLDGQKKDISNIREFGRSEFLLHENNSHFEASLLIALKSQDAGASEIERGVGVMLRLEFDSTQNQPWHVEIQSVNVQLNPRPRDETVTV